MYMRLKSYQVEMKLTTSLVLKIRLEILYFNIKCEKYCILTFNVTELQHQQNHIWFKGKNLKIKHINAIKYMF